MNEMKMVWVDKRPNGRRQFQRIPFVSGARWEQDLTDQARRLVDLQSQYLHGKPAHCKPAACASRQATFQEKSGKLVQRNHLKATRFSQRWLPLLSVHYVMHGLGQATCVRTCLVFSIGSSHFPVQYFPLTLSNDGKLNLPSQKSALLGLITVSVSNRARLFPCKSLTLYTPTKFPLVNIGSSAFLLWLEHLRCVENY